jgi:hypothetical protein
MGIEEDEGGAELVVPIDRGPLLPSCPWYDVEEEEEEEEEVRWNDGCGGGGSILLAPRLSATFSPPIPTGFQVSRDAN